MHTFVGDEIRRYFEELGRAEAELLIAAHTSLLHLNKECTTLALALMVQMEDVGRYNVKDLTSRHVPLPLRLCFAYQRTAWKLVWAPWEVWLTYWQRVADTTSESFIEVAKRCGVLRIASLPELAAESAGSHTAYACCVRCVRGIR